MEKSGDETKSKTLAMGPSSLQLLGLLDMAEISTGQW